MSDLPDTEEDLPPRGRSLRVRTSRIDYSENSEFEYEDNKKGSQKKRGSKRKAEVNVESLYCQENAKDTPVCPSLLETIYESPVKGQNRGRSRNVRSQGNIAVTESELQVMSVKKSKRFCAFADYYHPSKQKVKVRKDRAKKLKQLTGVKIPKGIVSDDSLKTILAVLSDEEDQNENVQKAYNDSSIFYVGNIIRPDIEDPSLNDVIRNISSMKMITDNCDERESPNNNFMEVINESLPFTDEKPNTLPVVPHEKKSRRRSEKFSGILLPCVKSAMKKEDDGKHKNNEGKLLVSPRNSTEDNLSDSEACDLIKGKTTPKRRNVLNDKKVVKKQKQQELSLKRQSESKDGQCQKKRGDMKLNISEIDTQKQFCEFGVVSTVAKAGSVIKFDVENSSGIANVLPCNEISSAQYSDLSVHISKHMKSGVGKKQGKRRVSGIRRPLYRKLIEPLSPEVLKSPDHSPKVSSVNSSPLTSFNTHNEHLIEVKQELSVPELFQQNGAKMCSPTSPCTQMAALSLQSERDPDLCNLVQKSLKPETPKRVTRRRSAQLSRLPVFNNVSSANPCMPLSQVVVIKGDNKATCDNNYINGTVGLEHNFFEGEMEKCKIPEVIRDVGNVPSPSDKERERMKGHIASKREPLEKDKDIVFATKGSDCTTYQRVGLTDKVSVPEYISSESNSNYPPHKEKEAFSMIKSSTLITSQIQEECSGIAISSKTIPEVPECGLVMKISENACSSVQQPLVKDDTCKASIGNKDLFSVEEDFDSPIITGMFANKANIRCGRIYRNRLSAIESPIILTHLENHKAEENVLN